MPRRACGMGEARDAGADMIALPEMFLTGYQRRTS
jgi:predicted amidohydrolase